MPKVVVEREVGELSDLVELVVERLEDCVDRVLRKLREAGRIGPDADGRELRSDVRLVLRLSLGLLGDDRPAVPDELGQLRALGRRRARQGIELDAVVRWLHVTEVVLWELVTDLAKDHPPTCPQTLLHRAAGYWSSFDELSSAVGEGHRETASSLAISVRQQALALATAVERYPESAEHAEELARNLGLDPSAPLAAVVHAGTARDVPWQAPLVVAEQAERTILLLQLPEEGVPAEEEVVTAIEEAGIGKAGVGLARVGIAGMHLSLRDAELALAAADATGTVVCFRTHWLEALGVTYRQEHEPLLAPAVDRIRFDPSARATLVAHIEHRGSLTAAGRALNMHANTVSYRLRQFAEHTGVDPRTAAGLALAQSALTLADMADAAESSLSQRSQVAS